MRARDRVVVVGMLLVGAAGTACAPRSVTTGGVRSATTDVGAPAGCERIVGLAPPRLRSDVRRVCNADTYDRGAFTDRSGPRRALECLLAHGGARELFAALARHESAVVRTYGREGLERVQGWTPELLRAAVLDGARVRSDDGEPTAASFGAAAMVQSDPGLAAAMLPTLLQTSGDADLVFQVVARAGHEPWIAEQDLARLAIDPRLDQDARDVARERLAERRTSVRGPVPLPWGRRTPECLDDFERELRAVERAERERALQLEREWREASPP